MLTSGFINSFSSRSPPTKGKNTKKCLLEVVRMQPVVQAWVSNRWSESEKKIQMKPKSQCLNFFLDMVYTLYCITASQYRDWAYFDPSKMVRVLPIFDPLGSHSTSERILWKWKLLIHFWIYSGLFFLDNCKGSEKASEVDRNKFSYLNLADAEDLF